MSYIIPDDYLRYVNNLFQSLLTYIPYHYKNLHLAFTGNEVQGSYKTYRGAYAVQGTVVYGLELVNYYTNALIPNALNDNVQLMVLAHELGHHVLGHTYNYDDGNNDSKCRAEWDADMYALYLFQCIGKTNEEFLEAYITFEDGPFRNNLSEVHKDRHGESEVRVQNIKNHIRYLQTIAE